MARLTNKQKFDILKDKIIPMGLHIVNGENVTEENYSNFDSYVGELWQFKPTKTLNEDEIITLHWFVGLVYRCIEDRKNPLMNLLFKWTC